MPNLFVSFVRTLVPVVAGLVLSWAARLGLDLDDAQVTTYVTAGLTAVYYVVFRGLEELAERMGWRPVQLLAGVLLGWARPPQYPGKRKTTVTIDLAGADEQMSRLLRDVVRRTPGPGGGER